MICCFRFLSLINLGLIDAFKLLTELVISEIRLIFSPMRLTNKHYSNVHLFNAFSFYILILQFLPKALKPI